jgi:hypothetical protein
MKLRNLPPIIILILVFGTHVQVCAQLTSSPTDPQEARIVYDDIENFIRAFEMLESNSDTIQVMQKHYIDKGTSGLKIFIEKYGLTASKLKTKISQYPEDYAAVEEKMKWLKSREPTIRLYFAKLKIFIPNAVYPPTYYLIGRRRGVGSGSVEGQLITIEKKAVDTVDIGIEGHIIHELTHLNQLHAIGSLDKYLAIYNDEKSLLAICIREGVAEFFADLVSGEGKTEVRNYIAKHEMEIWRRFENDMLGTDTKDWVFDKPEYQEQPQDVGYVLGAMIVEYYYKHSINLEEAVNEILSITDYQDFLEKSQYASKFKDETLINKK